MECDGDEERGELGRPADAQRDTDENRVQRDPQLQYVRGDLSMVVAVLEHHMVHVTASIRMDIGGDRQRAQFHGSTATATTATTITAGSLAHFNGFKTQHGCVREVRVDGWSLVVVGVRVGVGVGVGMGVRMTVRLLMGMSVTMTSILMILLLLATALLFGFLSCKMVDGRGLSWW